jgi:hypothetical protein
MNFMNNDIELEISSYKIEGVPKKLNITWTRSKWGIFQNNVPELGPCKRWYTHMDKHIWLPYTESEFLFFFLKGYGYTLHFLKNLFKKG